MMKCRDNGTSPLLQEFFGGFIGTGAKPDAARCICMWFLLLVLILGIAYGFLHKGKEDKLALLKIGAVIGIILGIVFGLASIFLFPGLFGIGLGLIGAIGIFVAIIIYAIIFIIGVFVGDFLEDQFRK